MKEVNAKGVPVIQKWYNKKTVIWNHSVVSWSIYFGG